ncbi:MAG: hypothetical protein IIC27_04405 [Chloroflexi bacterium]|nr:hypothetical protein [Chloroflexota bacterium]
MASPKGAFIDSTLDRFAEVAAFLDEVAREAQDVVRGLRHIAEGPAEECEDTAALAATGEPRVGSESALVQDSVKMVVRDSSGKVKAEGCIE